MKINGYQIVFREVPDETSLALSITNCQYHCKNCHSPELRENTGQALTYPLLQDLIKRNEGITCVLFLGSGVYEYATLNKFGGMVHDLGLKSAVYLGEDQIPDALDLMAFDYVKIGHYDEKKGPLDCKTTNQIMYEIVHRNYGYLINNITNKFWRNED